MPDPHATPSNLPRRFRFGLRSLFVLVTLAALVCAWVTYSLNWIRERQEILSQSDKFVIRPDGSRGRVRGAYVIRSHTHRSAPGGLWLFGATGVDFILIDQDSDEHELERIRRLFPESHVTRNTKKALPNSDRTRGRNSPARIN